MNMTVTESDKKLLSFLAAFILAIAFIFFVFKPLSEKNSALQKEIDEAKQQEISMDQSASLAADMAQTEQDTKIQVGQVLQRFYPMLQSQEAGNMVTVLMLNHNIKIHDMSIVMPEKASSLKWYQYSENADPLVPDEASEEDGEQVTGEEFGVYTARVTCSGEGDKDDLMAFIDDISGNFPAISILSTEWSIIEKPVPPLAPAAQESEEEASGEDGPEDESGEEPSEEPLEEQQPAVATRTTGSLTVTLEIYMCNQ